VNSKLFQPFSACAQHARNRFVFGPILWSAGIAILLSLAFPIVSSGASCTISGLVFVDSNSDGVFQNGDLGVRGNLIQLFNQNDEVVAQTYTNSTGQYYFYGLASGSYTVRNTIICYAGGAALDGQILSANGNLVSTDIGDPNSALYQISNITLAEGQQAINYNFGDSEYPIQIYSKYLLIDEPSYQIQPGKITPVPEPAFFAQLLTAAGTACGWILWRRRRAA
jgi:hypothetical protein